MSRRTVPLLRFKRITFLILVLLLSVQIAAADTERGGELDWGDAPDDGDLYRYNTRAESNGAAHPYNKEVYLGDWVEPDEDGQPHVPALGDDRLDGTDDEDGVSVGPMRPGATSRFVVDASVQGYLTVIVDFDGDGDFEDADEVVMYDQTIAAGQSTHLLTVPDRARSGQTYARFRFSSRPLKGVTDKPWSGVAADGEVEDYLVKIDESPLDYLEPNDDLEKALRLGSSGQSRPGLSIDNGSDADYFEWVAPGSGPLQYGISMADGNSLQMQVLDSNGKVIADQVANGGQELLEIEVIAGETYYFAALPYEGLVVDYELSIWPQWTCTNYVILFAGGGSKNSNYTRYYDNIKNLYEEIVDNYPVQPKNVYILYADGTDPATDLNSGGSLINSDMSYATNEGANVMAGTDANLEDLLTNTLPRPVDGNDHVLFYGFDHGGGSLNAATTGEETLTGYGGSTDDADLETWLTGLGAYRQTSVHAQCFAGGMIDNMTPTGANRFGMAATNHYEYSWGDGFAAAFVDALAAGKDDTYDAYKYTHDNDPYAVARGTYPDNGDSGGAGSIEHPWATGTNNYPIFCSNRSPWWLDIIYTVWVHPLDEVIFPYDLLVAHLGGTPPLEGDLRLRIEDVSMGELFLNEKPVVPGVSEIGYGEELVWKVPGRAVAGEQMMPFSVRASSGEIVSDQALGVPVRFEGRRAPPAVDDVFEVEEDGVQVLLDVLANDNGSSPQTVLGVGQPQHGSVEIIDGSVHYTPAANFSGEDMFTYVMGDSLLETDSATVLVKVAGQNDVPEANIDFVEVKQNGEVSTISPLVNDFDADLDELSASLPFLRSGSAGGGTVIDNGDNTFYYAPAPGFTGTDSFQYVAKDGKSQTTGTVELNVVADSGYDWGDAPEFAPQIGMGYRTTLARDGARHLIGGPYFGDMPDSEAEGVPQLQALGDNTSSSDDENGVVIGQAVTGGFVQVEVTVNGASGSAVIDAWIDWHSDLQWFAGDKVLGATVGNGTHIFQIPVPADAVAGDTYARFRISSAGNLSQTGAAADGEVEDHLVTILPAIPTAISAGQSAATAFPLALGMVLVVALLAATALTVRRVRSE